MKKIRKPIVVVIRDPDYANEYHTFGVVNTYDIDCGAVDLDDTKEAREWARGHMYHAVRYAHAGHPDVAALIEDTVSNYVGTDITEKALAHAQKKFEKEYA